jgi:hypothetical protein
VYVPAIGDLMTTRWSYEAMAVEQFRSGKYMKPYFNTDMMISRYDWQSSFLIPELKKKSNEAAYASDKPEYSEIYENDIEKLSRYITALSDEAQMDPQQAMRVINKNPFTSDASYIVNDYLDTLQKAIRKKYIYYTGVRDRITDSLVNIKGKDELVRLRERTYNKDLADIVLNRTVQNKLYETDNRIIQKADPVFMAPDSRIGRAQFYAPFKELGNWRINTIWFNLMIIWLFNTGLFVSLYFNLLKWLLNLLERIDFPGLGSYRMVS